MKHTETLQELFAALISFQSEIGVISFDKEVTVKLKTGGTYSYKYASFKEIKEKCSPLLKKNGLAVTQILGINSLTTLLAHSSGQYLGDTMSLPINDRMSPQDIGSVITYMKRYSYSAILGLVSDDDNDGKINTQNKEEKPVEKPYLTQEMPEWTKSIEWLKKGGDIELIFGKYQLTQDDEKELRRFVLPS